MYVKENVRSRLGVCYKVTTLRRYQLPPLTDPLLKEHHRLYTLVDNEWMDSIVFTG